MEIAQASHELPEGTAVVPSTSEKSFSIESIESKDQMTRDKPARASAAGQSEDSRAPDSSISDIRHCVFRFALAWTSFRIFLFLSNRVITTASTFSSSAILAEILSLVRSRETRTYSLWGHLGWIVPKGVWSIRRGL